MKKYVLFIFTQPKKESEAAKLYLNDIKPGFTSNKADAIQFTMQEAYAKQLQSELYNYQIEEA